MKRGATPLARWKLLTQELSYAMPLSPPMSEWLMTLYEHDVGRLSRKTGITYKGGNYKGDNLTYLLQSYGERELAFLVNPDDYRFIYVNEGDERPLVALKEEFVTDSTPAYSFAQRALQLKEERESLVEAQQKSQFRRDVQEASAQRGSRTAPKKPSKAEANRAVVHKAREAQAVQRAIDVPVKSNVVSATGTTQTEVGDSFANVSPLTILDRKSGKEQP